MVSKKQPWERQWLPRISLFFLPTNYSNGEKEIHGPPRLPRSTFIFNLRISCEIVRVFFFSRRSSLRGGRWIRKFLIGREKCGEGCLWCWMLVGGHGFSLRDGEHSKILCCFLYADEMSKTSCRVIYSHQNGLVALRGWGVVVWWFGSVTL